jgi:hypothetical protein
LLQADLNKYAKEDDMEFAERVKRLAQVNFVDLAINAYCSMLLPTFGKRAAGCTPSDNFPQRKQANHSS